MYFSDRKVRTSSMHDGSLSSGYKDLFNRKYFLSNFAHNSIIEYIHPYCGLGRVYFMNCHIHPDRPSVGTCVSCGKFICYECNTEINRRNHCKSCIEAQFQEQAKKIEKLEDNGNKQPMVFMNAGGGGGGSSSSSAASSSSGGDSRRAAYPTKSRMTAGILALLLGGLGAHKFYLGKGGTGILYLIFCWTFIPAFIGFIEGIIYLVSSDDVFAIKHDAGYRMQIRG